MNRITVNHWCKRCGLCAEFCPKKVFNFTPGHIPTVARPEGCVGCRMCQWRCPDMAIEVETEGVEA